MLESSILIIDLDVRLQEKSLTYVPAAHHSVLLMKELGAHWFCLVVKELFNWLSYSLISRIFQKLAGVSMVAQIVKNPPSMKQICVQSLGWEDPLEKRKATHSSILPWKLPWTEEPGRHGVPKSWTQISNFCFHFQQGKNIYTHFLRVFPYLLWMQYLTLFLFPRSLEHILP